MSSQSTLPIESQPQVKSEKKERDIIFTANGSARASEVVFRTGALVGMESLNTRPPREIPVEFVDWPFTKLDDYDDMGALFEAHIRIVADEEPRYAVAPDIDGNVSYDDAIEWADELAEYAETVIVVPKTVLPTDIPERFRVGMPCQERFGPIPWKWPQYRHCDSVHLLGGSPVAHHEIVKYYVPVESVDTSVPVTSAYYGSFWNGERWEQADEGTGFYTVLKRSYSAMRTSMNPNRDVWNPWARNRRFDWEQAWREYNPDACCWGDDEIPGPPRYASDVPDWLPDGIL